MRIFLLLFGLIPALAAANECRFSAAHDFDVDAAGLKTIAFNLGSSDISVEGVPGLARIEVRARACASVEGWLSDLGVDHDRSGDRLSITPKQEHRNAWQSSGSSYAYIELHVRAPAALALEIRSISGDANVRNAAMLAFESASGDLDAKQIAGELTIDVSSGDVKGDAIGRVEVHRTASGDITLRNVGGDVRIERSGSGDLQLSDIRGNVDIGSVGSGDVSAIHVDRNVTVGSVGSGDVFATSIGGDFTVHASGSGDVRYHDVRGSVSVPRDND
ncbi:MAG: DUF4097 family beta strand repeat-containing protein [Rudaea sp.]